MNCIGEMLDERYINLGIPSLFKLYLATHIWVYPSHSFLRLGVQLNS